MKERQTGGFCLGYYIANDPLLYHRNSFFFVDTSVTGSFTSVLCRVLSSIHDLLFFVKYTR